MWPIGHAAVAYLLYSAYCRRTGQTPLVLGVVALFIGSQFPDLIDKPLAWYIGVIPTGRSLAHTLFVVIPVSIVVYLISRRYDRDEIGIAFGIGAISHSLVDALPALWGATDARFLLWPVLPIEDYGDAGPPTVFGLLMESVTDPYFHLEFMLLAAAILAWRADGYPGITLIQDSTDSRATVKKKDSQ